jgi:4-hydroxybenzoate polyprenyltransferase
MTTKIIKRNIWYIIGCISLFYYIYLRITLIDIPKNLQWELYKYNYLLSSIICIISSVIAFEKEIKE